MISIIDAYKKPDNELSHDFVKPSHIESPLTESDNDSNNKICYLTETDDPRGWANRETQDVCRKKVLVSSEGNS
jgi:hypothetical protein